MSDDVEYGLEKARSRLPGIVAEAHAGKRTVITRHGKPYAAVVPVADLEKRSSQKRSGFLALRGTGKGLWGKDTRKTLADLRAEWSDTGAGR